MEVIKRDGRLVPYDETKIYEAIKKAYVRVFTLDDAAKEKLAEITHKVSYDVHEMDAHKIPITVIQSLVESRLLDYGLTSVAEKYIEYRIQQDVERYGYEMYVKLTLRKV